MTREQLIALRKSLGISQEKMALILNYTRFHYHRIERGTRSMPGQIKPLIKREVGRYLLGRAQSLAQEIDKTKADMDRIENL